MTLFERMRLAHFSVILGGAALGWIIATSNDPVFPSLVVIATLVILIGIQARVLRKMLLLGLYSILVGYAFLGRTFANLGVSPIFIGEIILCIGLIWLATMGKTSDLARSHVVWGITLFMIWGAARTIPYIGMYGLSALRDAVVWGYALYAFIVAVLVSRSSSLTPVFTMYRRWAAVFLAWIPIARLADLVLGPTSPLFVPGDLSFFQLKMGDVAVHLAGIAAFHSQALGGKRALGWTGWALWTIGVILAGSTTRGGLLAILCGVILVFAVSRSSRLIRMTAVVLIVVLLGTMTGAVIDLERRDISVQQLARNLLSVAGIGEDLRGLEGTRQWRLAWWGKIWDYAVLGPYRLVGKGFGINLATDDGFQVLADESLRSPHNIHFTILARAGVPGLVLWLGFNMLFVSSVLMHYYHSRRIGHRKVASALLFVLVYWFAMVINASFDVYLEGPMGGIWFWCVIGLGIGIIMNYRRKSLFGPEESA